MAHHAWLDSLSEDWVSLPGSDSSQLQQPPPSSPPASSFAKDIRDRASRIPRPSPGTPGVKRPQHPPHIGSPSVLGERSPNDVNRKMAQIGPSKLSHESKPTARGRHLSRSVSPASASTSGSVIRNPVVHPKSQSASPSKSRENEPEWKRRLVHGELDYGESKDLFSSAGIGLENIFRPPQGPETCHQTMNDTTLPSSPPPYRGSRRNIEDEDDSEDDYDATDASVQHNTSLPRHVSFRVAEDLGAANSSAEYQSRPEQTDEVSNLSIRVTGPNGDERKASGQSVLQNEDFSPILIARHSSAGGGVSFTPMEIPANQLRKKLEIIQRNQMILDSEPQTAMAAGAEVIDAGAGESETTEEYAKRGGFLNIRRGGRFMEESFRRRSLSPPLNIDSSDMLPESSLQASTPKQFPTVRIERVVSAVGGESPASPPSPDLPRAPYPSPDKRPQPALSQSQSGSPLKLFGPYDTFTNQTLLRRISQFEDQPSNSLTYSDEETALSPTPMHGSKAGRPSGTAEPSSARKPARLSQSHQELFGAVNRFGAGHLDDYEFDGDISISSSVALDSEEKENKTPEPSRVAVGSPLRFDVYEDSSAEGKSLPMRRSRQKTNRPASSTRHTRPSKSFNELHADTAPDLSELENFFPSLPRRGGSEGKRPRTSPSKDPTPKRRRTLHRSDIAFGLEQRLATIEMVQSSHHTMQSVITRSRQKSLNLSRSGIHHILRPRSTTSSQRASEFGDRAPLTELGFKAAPDLVTVPASGLGLDNPSTTDSRKASLKTQDFYEAAEEVMAMIRNKARPITGLASVEESGAESSGRPSHAGPFISEETFQESTEEPFSRPPSREGRPLPRLPARQEDPELVDRLKKYEDHSDVDDILAQSLRSLRPLKDLDDEGSSWMGAPNESSYLSSQPSYMSQDLNRVISDLPNVRISRNPDNTVLGSSELDFPSHKSQFSAASTFPSVRTGSSRGSDSRRLIAPDAVAQLIGNQVGNMVFDEEHKIWQKVKTPKPARDVLLPSEDSEDDPFASIPDLTVDINKERNHLGMAAGQGPGNAGQAAQNDNSINASSSHVSEPAAESVKSEHSVMASMQGQAETAVEDDEEIEHEISLHEDRMQKTTPSRKNLTITFSSPIASVIHDLAHRATDDNSSNGGPSREPALGGIAADSIGRGRHGGTGRSVSGRTTRSSSRSRSRGLKTNASTDRHGFVPRPVSRIDEQDESNSDSQQAQPEERGQLSILAESVVVPAEPEPQSYPELSVVMATPDRMRTGEMFATPIIGQYVGTLSLTPMSEFTIHQMDKSCALEVSYVVDDQYLVTGDGSKKVMSKAVRSLVEKITEVEPFEPDWETMPELDLSNKQLDTLHMLDEFCTAVVTLDASNNSVSHLDGVPQGVRNLRMTHNLLSELTAWRQLMNLQYVDVSHNQLTSLSAFKDLVHLRNLRADNNKITSLDGIKLHDTLQVLRLRGNLITHVDFEGTKLQRLMELDLENNQIVTFENSEQLSSLHTLNLQQNHLKTFRSSESQALSGLRYLKLSGNDLETVDLAALPSLRLLHADRNNITTITGFSQCRRLDSLSLREQKGNRVLDTSFLDPACEVRKLFLSGNRLSGFSPRVDFLNLQYLELANCGLRSLEPSIGQLMPNLRVLNINFNAIDDLLPLRFIPRLKKLLAAGNRLSEAGKVANALADFPHLSRLDLRNNGASLGFYAPVQTLLPTEDDDAREGKNFDPFVLPDIDVELQDKFASRLDIDTKMRKRIYDMVILNHCKRITMLDGLPVNRDTIASKDDVWEALVQTGIVEGQAEQQANAFPQ